MGKCRMRVILMIIRGWECALASLPALQNNGSVTAETFDARACRYVTYNLFIYLRNFFMM